MGEKLLKCSANFMAGFDQLLKEGNFVDCSLAAEGQTLKAHRVVLSAASAYFELLFSEEHEREPIIIFTNIRYNQLEDVLRLIYQGEVEVSEDRLAEFLNVLTFLQINGLDCNELVMRKTNVTTFDNAKSFSTFETTTIQEGSSDCEKVECEVSVEELADNHILPQYLPLEESSSTKLASDYSSNVLSMPPCQVKSDLGDFENGLSCSTNFPACGYEFSRLVTDIEIKDLDEEINSNVKIEKDDMTTRIEDEPTLEGAYQVNVPWKNDDNDREVYLLQCDANLQNENVQNNNAVTYIGNGEQRLNFLSCDFETPEETDYNVPMCHFFAESSTQLPHCSLYSMQSNAADNHEFKNLKGKSFKCSQCAYTCTRKGHMMMHMRTHTGEKPFKCELCSFACSQKSNLIIHMRTHAGEKLFKCEQCSYACSLKCNLKTHMRTHTGEKPFKCSQCAYACSQKNGLIIHMRTHTGEKPFKCARCSFACSYRHSLIIHMRTHTGEKPFKCSHCTYSGARRDNLIMHMSRHVGEKPFKCPQCIYTSDRKESLIMHMNTHARGEPV